MNDSYRAFFGLTKEPFSTELTIKEILETPDLKGVKDRFDYAVRLGAVALVTGITTTLLLGIRSTLQGDKFAAAHQPRFPDLPPPMTDGQ